MVSLLGARSNFSIGESILTVERLVEATKQVGATAVALTDTMTVTGLVDFTQRAKKANLKPIIACRLRFVDDVGWRKERGKGDKKPPEFDLIWYVLSDKGLQALYRLLSLAYSESHFYYYAKLGFADLYAALDDVSAEDVCLASSDVYSVLAHHDAREILARCSDALSRSNVFLTLTPVDAPLYDTLNAKSIALGQELGLPYLLSRPIYYGGPEEALAHEVMGGVATNSRADSMWFNKLYNRDFYPLDRAALGQEIRAAAQRLVQRRGLAAETVKAAFRDALQQTEALADRVTYEWVKQPPSLPKMAEDEHAALVAECLAGWRERFTQKIFGYRPSHEELETVYAPRLRYELATLQRLNFSGYFLLVQDVVRYAKKSGILVGPGRGSVGGSLVAYLMGVTDCDPLRFNLLFERFINPDRLDLPDADLDFMSERRHEVVAYLIEKYGKERVAGVANFMALGTASSIRDVSRVLALPEPDYACSKYAPKEHGAIIKLDKSAEQVPEIAMFRDKFPEVWDICRKLEGVMRNLGQHAAGIVVAGCDLTERAFIDRRKGGEGVVCWDKRIVENQGLIKMDILGLSTLDLIALALKYIRERYSKKVNLSAIPLDDPEVLDLFAKGRTTGIFQFESGGMRRLLKELGKDGDLTFEDIAAATALYRPGPMESGMMDAYWKRKRGLEPVDYDHPALKPILQATFGVIVYQEQVMQAAQAICGYSAADADKLRKIMGKKLPEEMAKERDKFVAGAVATIGATEEWAGKLFDKIQGFASYGFNRSHAIEYSLISYQSAYLKTHFKVEFYAAALTLLGDDKLPAILADAKQQGVEIDTPDVNISTERFEILNDRRLSIPFSRVKGLSVNAAKAIVTARGRAKFVSRENFIARCKGRLVHAGKVELLDKIGAFASIEPESLAARHPSRIKDQIDLIPGLISETVPIDRPMCFDSHVVKEMIALINGYVETLDLDGKPVKPALNTKHNKLMVVLDAPSTGRFSEESLNYMGRGDAFAWQATSRAMGEVGFSIKDLYITALLKRPKAAKTILKEEMALYAPILEREIALLQPPLIIALGSATARWFFPDLRGKASEHAGKIRYHAGFDANIVLGFSPGEIWHDPDKQELLTEVFANAMRLTDI